MTKRRKRKSQKKDIQKVVVSLNPQYIEGLPDSLSLVLPTPKQMHSECETPFIWQKQSDSGDFLVFFKTRWLDRDSLGIFTEQSCQSATVFYLMPEESYEDRSEFINKFGYDIPWDRITEINWDVFKRFVITTASLSVYSLLEQTSLKEIDNPVVFVGSLLWLPKILRESVSKVGNFTTDMSILSSMHHKMENQWN